MKSIADWSKHFDNILILLNDISNRPVPNQSITLFA